MTAYLITCNHATCAIPTAHRELFKGQEDLVTSEKGWEPGALNLAQGLAMKLSTPLIHGDVTRLLIDLDEEKEKRWSKISSKLPEATRAKLVDRHEHPFRHAIEMRLTDDYKRRDNLVHVMVHTAPIETGKITFEYAHSPLAKKIATSVAASLPKSEVDSTAIPLVKATPFINWVTENHPSEKYGLIRITVSRSFFMKSIPMRWETIKKAIIQNFHKASLEQ
ncbi:MAG: hypothetical protein ACSHX7_00475 [Luteolibacter sp.]